MSKIVTLDNFSNVKFVYNKDLEVFLSYIINLLSYSRHMRVLVVDSQVYPIENKFSYKGIESLVFRGSHIGI